MKLNRIIILKLFIIVVVGSFLIAGTNLTKQKYGNKPIINDYSKLSWTEAFKKMHSTFSKEYAFTKWKDIDWESLRKKHLPQIEEAEKNKDINLYATSLREYTFSIPDGHVRVEGDFSHFLNYYNGGIFELLTIKLDDGRFIAFDIEDEGSAAKSGIKLGAEILKWNNKPIQETVNNTSIIWSLLPGGIAKKSCKQLVKIIQLSFGFVNEKINIEYKNPNETIIRTAVLTAQKRDKKNHKLYPFAVPVIPTKDTKELTYKILPSGIGYIRINILLPFEVLGRKKSFTFKQFKEIVKRVFYNKMEDAIRLFNKNNVSGVIVDIRGNGGGDSFLTADLCGYFFDKPSFYAYETYYNPKTDKFPIISEIWIKPKTIRYTGNVIALVNLMTASAAEGIAMAVKRLKKGNVIGFYGTFGSFGCTGGVIRMPNDFTIYFPVGQSLNINKIIEIDSRKNGKGGVNPDPKIPLTYENVLKVSKGEDVELKFAENFILNKGK